MEERKRGITNKKNSHLSGLNPEARHWVVLLSVVKLFKAVVDNIKITLMLKCNICVRSPVKADMEVLVTSA